MEFIFNTLPKFCLQLIISRLLRESMLYFSYNLNQFEISVNMRCNYLLPSESLSIFTQLNLWKLDDNVVFLGVYTTLKAIY